MPWIRFEDNFPEHPKVLEAGPRAAWLHVRAIAYCARHLTDGQVSLAVVKTLNGRKGLTDALVKAKLWDRHGDGFTIHDYLHYQPSRAAVEEQRQIKAEAGRKGGLNSHGSKR